MVSNMVFNLVWYTREDVTSLAKTLLFQGQEVMIGKRIKEIGSVLFWTIFSYTIYPQVGKIVSENMRTRERFRFENIKVAEWVIYQAMIVVLKNEMSRRKFE